MTVEGGQPLQGGNLPSQIFERFLDGAAAANVPKETIEALRQTLLDDKLFKESALKKAILGEDTLS